MPKLTLGGRPIQAEEVREPDIGEDGSGLQHREREDEHDGHDGEEGAREEQVLERTLLEIGAARDERELALGARSGLGARGISGIHGSICPLALGYGPGDGNEARLTDHVVHALGQDVVNIGGRRGSRLALHEEVQVT